MDDAYYGKYRGKVENNIDPKLMGRIMVSVSGLKVVNWAMPCSPMAGRQMGVYAVPQKGALVWVEFEQGNLDYPVWSGGFWSEIEIPSAAMLGQPGSPSIVLSTDKKNQIVISDLPGPTGGLMIKSASGASILVNDLGIFISNGKASINLVENVVNINNGALTIT